MNMIINSKEKSSDTSSIKANRFQKFARLKILEIFTSLKGAELVVRDPLGTCTNFQGSDSQKENLAQISFKPSLGRLEFNINNLNFYTRILTTGSLGAAESYIQNEWSTNNLTGLVQLLLRNRQQLDKMDRGFSWAAQKLFSIFHFKKANTLKGSKKNISAHYDLSNDFFFNFLDTHKMYSSALYSAKNNSTQSKNEASTDDLEQASIQKLHKICDQLDLKPSDHLIEIGTGWGGLAIFAAEHYGCKVTTTTISDEQHQYVQTLIREKHLEEKIMLLKKDYRLLEGTYDKLVSVEMIEAVGHQFLSKYMRQCANLVKPEGKILIQAILIEDYRYKESLKEVDFIKKYIFPGSFIPSASVITETAAQNKLRLIDFFDFGKSYAQTLKDWRNRFYGNQTKIEALGFDEPFLKLWEFYLCYCEGGFLEETISVAHLTFKKAG